MNGQGNGAQGEMCGGWRHKAKQPALGPAVA